jgi:RNA polymerase sigma-B factor
MSDPRMAAPETVATRQRLRLKRDEDRNRSMIHRYPYKSPSTRKFTLKFANDLATLVMGSYSSSFGVRRTMAVAAAVRTVERAPREPHTGRSLISKPRRTPRTSAARRAAVRRLLGDYHRCGDMRARERLIGQYLPLVRRLARRHVGRGEPFEDLVQVGTIGLINAIDRFKLERGVDLATFAIPTIDGEIKRHLRDRAWPIRIPRRLQELDPTLRARVTELVDGQNGEFDREVAVDRGYELGEDRIALARGFQVLDARERLLLRLAYFEGLSQAQIAGRVGISQIHVSRLTRRALEKLRVELGQE